MRPLCQVVLSERGGVGSSLRARGIEGFGSALAHDLARLQNRGDGGMARAPLELAQRPNVTARCPGQFGHGVARGSAPTWPEGPRKAAGAVARATFSRRRVSCKRIQRRPRSQRIDRAAHLHVRRPA